MDEKREHIITTAEKLFIRFGFRKTTVDEIARAAGMGKSTLYYYFNSKEEIFAAVLRKNADDILQKLAEALEHRADPQEKLRNYIVTRMNVMKDISNYFDMLKTEYFAIYPLIEQERKGFLQQEVEMVTGLFQEGVTQGVFAVKDIGSTVNTFISILRGLEEQWFLNDDETFTMEPKLDDLLHILLKGLETR